MGMQHCEPPSNQRRLLPIYLSDDAAGSRDFTSLASQPASPPASPLSRLFTTTKQTNKQTNKQSQSIDTHPVEDEPPAPVRCAVSAARRRQAPVRRPYGHAADAGRDGAQGQGGGVHQGHPRAAHVRLQQRRGADPPHARRGGLRGVQRAGRPGPQTRHQGVLQLAHHPPGVHQQRVCGRLRHPAADAPERRPGPGARQAGHPLGAGGRPEGVQVAAAERNTNKQTNTHTPEQVQQQLIVRRSSGQSLNQSALSFLSFSLSLSLSFFLSPTRE